MPICFKNLESCPFVLTEKSRNVFVLMPLNEEMKKVYTEGIKQIFLELGWVCNRSDEKFDTPEVVCTICKNIQEASLVLADLTGRNPNVFLEIGLAFGMGKHVVFLSQGSENIPFDAKTFRTLFYDPSSIKGLKQDIQSLIKNVKSKQVTSNTSSFYKKCAERSKVRETPKEPLMEVFIGAEVPTNEWLSSTTKQNLKMMNAIPPVFNVLSVIARREYFEFNTRSQPFFVRVDSDGFFHAVVRLKQNSGIYVSLIVREIAEALFFMTRILKKKDIGASQIIKIDLHGTAGLEVSLYHQFVFRGGWSFSKEQTSVSYVRSFDPQANWASFLSIISEIYKEIFIDLGITDADDEIIKINTMQTIQDVDTLRTEYSDAGIQRLSVNEILIEWTRN